MGKNPEFWVHLQFRFFDDKGLVLFGRVPPGHGKSWNFGKLFSRPGKSWKIAKVMENDDNVMEFLLQH